MSLCEPDYLSRFRTLIDRCAEHPHKARLASADKELCLYSINSVLYVDVEKMYNVLSEIFGTNTPGELMDYLRKVLFLEVVTVSNSSMLEKKELACTNFIDNFTLLKIHNWLLDYFSLRNDEEALFQKIDMSTSPKARANLYSMEQDDDRHNQISDMLPFSSTWDTDNIGSLVKAAQSSTSQGTYSQRPRGKQMPSRRDPTYERPFVCEFYGCRRAFKRLEHLKRHLKMHTGERPYKCLFPGCQKSFSRSDNLNSHYKTHNIIRKGTFGAYNYKKSFENF